MESRKNSNVHLMMSLFLLLGSSTLVAGKTIYVKEGATGGGSSWNDALGYLQDALLAASPGDLICVAKGTYRPDQGGVPTGTVRDATFQLKNNVEIYGGFPNTGNPAWDQRDAEQYSTILSGDIGAAGVKTDNSYHVVTGTNTDNSAILDGFVIISGYGFSTHVVRGSGGGMLNGEYPDGGSPTIRNCIFDDNGATHGGGVCNTDGSNPVFIKCKFMGNYTDEVGTGGGAMFNANSNPTITECHFENNYCKGDNSGGGAIRNVLQSSPSIHNCSFYNNYTVGSGTNGGAFYNSLAGCNPDIRGCVFYSNSSVAGGGAIYNSQGSLTLYDCVLYNNESSWGDGGGLYSSVGAGIGLVRCTFVKNTASSSGGGILCSSDNSVFLSNCVFNCNTCQTDGAGIYISDVSNPLIVNCTLYANESTNHLGGGLYVNLSTLDLHSSIFWNNAAATAGAQIAAEMSATVNISYSDIQGGQPGIYKDGSSFINWGPGNITDNPYFVDTSGPDGASCNEDDDFHLSEGSPCIDSGHPGLAYQDPDGSRNDMGAYGGPFGEPSEPGSSDGTGFVLTSIGKIPTSEIIQSDPDPKRIGLVDVSPQIAGQLGIIPYSNAPLGGTLWLHGLFGAEDNVDFYQILVGKWDSGTAPGPDGYVALNDSLTKVQYYVDTSGKWTSKYVTLGPKTISSTGGIDAHNLYELTDEGYWSHIDLRARWNTTAYENGRYTITYKAYRWTDPTHTSVTEVNLKPTGFDSIIIVVDNNLPVPEINVVKYDPSNPNYNAATDGEISKCEIIHLEDSNENLRFYITATHPTGYLRHYTLYSTYGKNNFGGTIYSESYPLYPDPYWIGQSNKHVQSGSSITWYQCGYRFRLSAYARTTNGFNYIYESHFDDHYYIDLGN